MQNALNRIESGVQELRRVESNIRFQVDRVTTEPWEVSTSVGCCDCGFGTEPEPVLDGPKCLFVSRCGQLTDTLGKFTSPIYLLCCGS